MLYLGKPLEKLSSFLQQQDVKLAYQTNNLLGLYITIIKPESTITVNRVLPVVALWILSTLTKRVYHLKYVLNIFYY